MIKVQILGIGDKKSRALATVLEEVLAMLPWSVDVDYVSDIAQMMHYDIAGIPALVVNGEVLTHAEVPAVPELRRRLLKFLFKHKGKAMKLDKILIPTDFSDPSRNASRFAQRLVQGNPKGRFRFIHAYHGNLDSSSPFVVQPMAELYEIKKEQMQSFVQSLAADQEVPFDYGVEVGFAVDEIVAQSKSDDVDLIVMGTTGEHGAADHFFGSVSSEVARFAHCPVLLVPETASYAGFKRILYASKDLNEDLEVLPQVADIARQFGADIHAVHVSAEHKKAYSERLDEVRNVLTAKDKSLSVTLAEVENGVVSDAIEQYAKTHAIDLIIAVTKHRNFLQNIFHRSVTKRLALDTTVPLLVLHVED